MVSRKRPFLPEPSIPQSPRIPLHGVKRESPRLHLIGEMNNTFEASPQPCLIRLKLQLLTHFSLSPAREGWELSTFSFLPNLCLLHQEESRGWGREGGRKEGGNAHSLNSAMSHRTTVLPWPGNSWAHQVRAGEGGSGEGG